jgi:Ran-binding protein 9/10
MLGWESGAWGFHSDDGKIFDNILMGKSYHIPYGRKNVNIGCGVNFNTNTAFYTRDGVVIGMNQG